MPYTVADVDKHKKGLSDKEKEQWVAVANSVLAQCVEEGGDEAECAAKAIQQASGVLKKQQEETMPDEVIEADEMVDGAEHPPSAEAEPIAEIGRRLSAAQVKKLKDAHTVIAEILKWADYEDGEPEPEPEEDEDMEAAEIELAESASGHVIGLAEAQLPLLDAASIVPLHLDVALITPGWGNKRDNHYYPRDVVERDATVFSGVKMYETDHRQDEKSTRTWVSTVKEIVGYTHDGAPVGRVSVHDRNFAERLMALAADDLLEKMECSILASGTARKGEIDGKKGHIVEAITSAESVDWVTRAGAGGRALSLAESNTGGESMDDEKLDAIETQETEPIEEPLEEVTLQEQQEPEEPPAPATLDSETVQELVGASRLPDAAKAKLSEAEYEDEEMVKAAIAAEVAYIKELTGSGKPFAQGAGSAPQHKPRSAEEQDADWKRILTEVGMPNLVGG